MLWMKVQVSLTKIIHKNIQYMPIPQQLQYALCLCSLEAGKSPKWSYANVYSTFSNVKANLSQNSYVIIYNYQFSTSHDTETVLNDNIATFLAYWNSGLKVFRRLSLPDLGCWISRDQIFRPVPLNFRSVQIRYTELALEWLSTNSGEGYIIKRIASQMLSETALGIFRTHFLSPQQSCAYMWQSSISSISWHTQFFVSFRNFEADGNESLLMISSLPM